MRKSIFMLMSLLILGISVCEKGGEGEIGPQGEKGERGEEGIAGIDGTKIISVSAVPSANRGAFRDFYLRTTNAMLYCPNTNDGCGSGTSLKGATGATGTNRLSGTAAPTPCQGANGDF